MYEIRVAERAAVRLDDSAVQIIDFPPPHPVTEVRFSNPPQRVSRANRVAGSRGRDARFDGSVRTSGRCGGPRDVQHGFSCDEFDDVSAFDWPVSGRLAQGAGDEQ
jgi:hypothetical protein